MRVGKRYWAGKRVFITGHTGFKGSWLSLMLSELGAEVTGYSLAPETSPSLFKLAGVEDVVAKSLIADVRDAERLARELRQARPDMVFHLAAQPLVRHSYERPVETYATNVMGTVHLLEAVRCAGSVKAAVVVTSDKCYENREWSHPYRECDTMGGHDPYSSSKGCSELVVAAYRNSYFQKGSIFDGPLVASVRAGNVIGGGDWSADRLVPDLVRAFETKNRPVIRSPAAVRPWQHVLEALSGYIVVAQRLLAGEAPIADAWNFGPGEDDAQTVGWIVQRMANSWGIAGDYDNFKGAIPHEANVLRLDTSKARALLGWHPRLKLADAIDLTVEWHKSVAAGANARDVTCRQIHQYFASHEIAPAKAA